MRPKKIFFLINSLDTGGSERVLSQVARDFSEKKGVEVKVFTIIDVNRIDPGLKYTPLVREKTISYTEWLFSSIDMFGAFSSYASKFRKIVEREKPDMIISFLELSNFINIRVSSSVARKPKCVISVRSNLSLVYDGFGNMLVREKIKSLYPQADMIIANSSFSAGDLVKNFGCGPGKVRVVHNPVDLERIERLAKGKLPAKYSGFFGPGVKAIISVGRLNHFKGQKYLLEAFANVRKKIASGRLVIVGDGELREKLKGQARDLGIESDVLFAGDQQNPYNFISKADVFAFTSVQEGFPNAMLEALACGTPVVSTDCIAGPAEILSPGSRAGKLKAAREARFGVLVPSFSESDSGSEKERKLRILESTIIKVLNSPSVRKKYRKAGPSRAGDFDRKKVSEGFFRTINSIL